MFIKLFSYFFGNKSQRVILGFEKIVSKINFLEKEYINYSDNDLKNNTFKFKDSLLSGKNIDVIIPYVYANIREAIKRVFGIRLFDVQLLGALVLNNGCIAEMKTGEGKTITATLPAYLNALLGKGVHIITVNDYLAKRDANNNCKLFNFLGLKVGLNLPGMSLLQKKMAYLADITYGTNNEYGFDYLRDNMVFSKNDKVQRKKLYYAILDEVDSILIDEARTPLVISGSIKENSDLYFKINKIIPYLNKQCKFDSSTNNNVGDFIVDEKFKHIFLTENGIKKVESLLFKNLILNKNDKLYTPNNIKIMHCIITSLKAYYLYKKNVDYLVENNNVIIIDEHSGRIMKDRRWSDGLHQAIEAKENVDIKDETNILSSITFQNYFRLYEKLSGMTGTAMTESSEFHYIYGLDTISIPTNKPMIRKDYSDLVFITEKEKINSIIEDIKFRKNRNQPVLVGTISIDKSELIASILHRIGIKFNILNAKFHSLEANIISQAGKLGAVTIATNMAGRGTDIILGGNFNSDIKNVNNKDNLNLLKINWKKCHDLVVKLGGLHVIGAERHESRRIDNQLRGRAGRQGDPGSSRFYVSMEDNLMRVFSSEKIIFFMRKLGVKYGDAIEHYWITKSIEKAQKRIENRNFDIRKQLLDYDNIYNDQRKIIFYKRDSYLYSENISIIFKNDILNKVIVNLIDNFYKDKKLFFKYCNDLNILLNFLDEYKNLSILNFKKIILHEMLFLYNKREKYFGLNILNIKIKEILLVTLDLFWREYLYAIDNLKEGIYLRSYAQKDPKQEYKIESFKMFSIMLNDFYYEVVKIIINLPY